MERIIVSYLEGTASEEDTQALLDWIHEKEENRVYFHQCRDIWITSGHLRTSAPESHMAFQRFKERVARYEKSKRGKKSIPFGYLKTAASIAVLIICSLGAYLLGTVNRAESLPPLVLNQTILRENKHSLRLPDGSLAWLNNHTQITYPEPFDEKERVVWLEGEAFLEVVHKDDSPFYVKTEHFSVQVLGTEFNVRSYSDKEVSEVVLLSGKVEVMMEGSHEPITLSPNQKLSFDKKSASVSLETVDASFYTLWKNEKLVMNNEELASIFSKMERWYDVDILCRGDIPLRSRYSITITDEPKEEIFRLLSMITPIKYRIDNEKVIITK
ncbi:MAG: DUF4974 domain-containing protein [Tannerellaceae bacterium]|jgi:ferric-dicitrate binding protein FerR (iron transport regulator)|nr:DUF4974 domain-containing protein [Tannerellaceae bacterium]